MSVLQRHKGVALPVILLLSLLAFIGILSLWGSIFPGRDLVEESLPIVNYTWAGGIDSNRYTSPEWHRITAPVFEGFGVPVSGQLLECSPFSYSKYDSRGTCPDNCLKYGGGIGGGCYIISVVQADQTRKQIMASSELRNFFAPVESEAEAVSFVSVREMDLRVRDGILQGHTAVIPEGYVVQAIFNSTFGCGPHNPKSVLFEVNRDGNITPIAWKQLTHNEKSWSCVD